MRCLFQLFRAEPRENVNKSGGLCEQTSAGLPCHYWPKYCQTCFTLHHSRLRPRLSGFHRAKLLSATA